MPGSKDGFQIDIGHGERLTVNSADTPSIPGGWYQSTTNDKGDKSAAVYDADGDVPSGGRYGDNDDSE
jgi:hypothetical protein